MDTETLSPIPWRRAFRIALPATLPVLAGFSFLGIAFGILLTSKGYGAVWAFLMSALAFGGSMQYVAVTLLCAAFDPMQAFLLSLTVNARHIFYGLAFLSEYRGMGKLKPLLICLLCDESFSILAGGLPREAQAEGSRARYCFAVSLLNYIYWVSASLVGGILGALLTQVEGFDTTGFDFVLTALFVVILIDSCREKEKLLPAGIGILASVICLLIFGAEDFLLPSMAAIALLLMLVGKAGWVHDA